MSKEIFVISYGWVLVGTVVSENDKHITLTDASVIERWGTTEGIGQLALGFTDETRLRKMNSDTTINTEAILFRFMMQ